MNTNNSYAGHSLNLQEHGIMPLHMERQVNTEWEKFMHSGHDASYIVRKRALLLDLWNMELPCDSSALRFFLSKEEKLSKNYKDYAQKEFLKEVSEENNFWHSKENLASQKNSGWTWDCPATVQ